MAEAILDIKASNYGHAARLLSAQLSDDRLKPTSKVVIMEWIGECLNAAGERSKAATWFERAARSALACGEVSEYARRKRALRDLEQARDGYSSENDLGGIRRVAVVKYALANEFVA